MAARVFAAALIGTLALSPSAAMAHDDPVVTVRVLTNGFNVLDMEAVLGEISDSATLSVDRTVRGSSEIQAWVREQMDDDLRFEILDIGTPQKLSDGYTLNWTARLSRQDWRKTGLGTRRAANTVVIHNGRITEWTAVLDSTVAVANPSASQAATVTTQTGAGYAELFGIPLTLLLAGVLAIGGAFLLLRSVLRR